MNQEGLQAFFVHQMRDLYDAEKQLTKALPKMAKAGSSDELREAIGNHLKETENHVTRLEEVFQAVGASAKGKHCAGMRGLIEEGSEQLEVKKGARRDVAIIAAAQRAEHYEISAYGTAKALAKQLGNDTAVRLLEETQEEEHAADSKLTEIAISIYQAMREQEEGKSPEEPSVPSKGPARQTDISARRPRDASGR